jgi:hypothetical protein
MEALMANAMFLASIFGPLMFFIGLWMILFTKNLSKMLAAVKASPVAMWNCGFVKLLLGLTIVNMYNVWSLDMSVLVTLLGWVMLVRGLMVFFMPKVMFMTKTKKESSLRWWSLLPLVWGLLLWWMAFMS